jgi:hypothetical protein
MVRTFGLPIALVAALASVQARARSPGVESQGQAPLSAADFDSPATSTTRDPRATSPVIDMSGRITSAERSVGDGDGTARTAVDYSLAPHGVFGSLGFICLGDDAPITARDVGPMAGADDGRLLGGTIRYPLR